ncbi:MAG: orotidine-5'-phosphate decarboxylase [Syntrophomonadaceae bacterium]|nr:orotidine-5'-phosphate decarboxylase [Syntrophomonadaceae bacterium]
MEAKERIILALDVDEPERALDLARQLSPYVGAFKIGMQLFNSAGPQIVRDIQARGGEVFVDLKFHDIPNTVGAASKVMTRLGAKMFNLHAAGGREMMKAAADAAADEAARLGLARPIVLAVTVLTSISQAQLEQEMMVTGHSVSELALRWAVMAKKSGLSGVVCSPHEAHHIKQHCGPDFLTVTPGIRPAWSAANDQKRITPPAQAVRMGADYMVIGRPITAADDPVAAAARIISELEAK